MGEAPDASPLQMSEDTPMIVERKTRDINRYLSDLPQGKKYYVGMHVRVRPEHARLEALPSRKRASLRLRILKAGCICRRNTARNAAFLSNERNAAL